MGCVPTKLKFCPLCHEQSRLQSQSLCDKCSFVREYVIKHGREGVRHALRNPPYDQRSMSRHQSTSSLTRAHTFPNESYNLTHRCSLSKHPEATAPPARGAAPAYYSAHGQ